MTPQAGLPPALPVFKESAWPPLPKSSVPAWTTTVLPKMEVGPNNLTKDWSTVGLTEWVEVRTSRGTTVSVVTEFMNVETTFSVSIVTGDFVRNGGWFVFRDLFKGNSTGNTGITT
ncbi:hypothetical protein WICPIJ_005864 [Wickerhamomyces pijperi]|uniref:Uncharacterized protein n=1 Tax=Wickerhamomyces pijperi TaxID=599730 RepID=A0A9P8Q391_WICPI|nr:hypothetical protein WICPIJ_005864 [Wickerhamomyces pijperi]